MQVTTPASLRTIGFDAFNGCKSLKYVNISDGLEVVGAGAFSESGLESFFSPESLKKINRHAFYGCQKLRGVRLNKNLEDVNESAFEKSPIEDVIVEAGCKVDVKRRVSSSARVIEEEAQDAV